MSITTDDIEKMVTTSAFLMIAGLAATDTIKRRQHIISWLEETKRIIQSDPENTFDTAVIIDAIEYAKIQADMRTHPFFRNE